MNTVNVLEIIEGEIFQMKSFEDTHEGNKKAEDFFKKFVSEYIGKNSEVMEEYLEDGYFSTEDGLCEIIIRHSD